MRYLIVLLLVNLNLVSIVNAAKVKTRPDTDKIALTFDDGPDPAHTLQILEILKQYDVLATFFVVGKNAKAFPDILKAIRNGGHIVANHSYRHPFMSRLSTENVTQELRKTNNAIFAVTGEKPKCMRPPYGDVNAKIRALAQAEGLQTVLWDLDSDDHKGGSPESLANRVLSNSKGGQVILMHDLGRSGSITKRALPAIIEGLRAQNLSFETICE